ncbi:MAG: HYR domain-containing protein, partial [Planctomycetes bacterium]|nr:HYR domain-containing protein [Planctomycetota bacterium]
MVSLGGGRTMGTARLIPRLLATALCAATTMTERDARQAGATPRLTLEPDATCYSTDGTITVEVWMRDMSAVIVGGQFFLSYDTALLGLLGADPGPVTFTREIYEACPGGDGDGTIDYAVGIPDGDSGTSSDTAMAVLTFAPLMGVCDAAELVVFRPHTPPTRLSDDADNPVEPLLVDLPSIGIDGTDPTLSDCPSDIIVPSDPGSCSAMVTWTPPMAADNCPGVELSSTHDPGDVFPVGATTVTYTATDACSNIATCDFDVTVEGYNELAVTVELSPTLLDPDPGPGDTVTRCITFELWECPGTDPVAVISEELVFSVDTGVPHIGTATLQVPCQNNYTCITARDELHSLRSTDNDDFGIVGTEYVADFTDRSGTGSDDDSLLQGNLNDDYVIDIVDFGSFIVRWGQMVDPDTDCPVTDIHADINASGEVDTADFTFIQIHFLAEREANCCGQPDLVGDEPRDRISVAELCQLGLAELVPADLNGDGWLDTDDMAAFADGARPRSWPEPVPFEPVGVIDAIQKEGA